MSATDPHCPKCPDGDYCDDHWLGTTPAPVLCVACYRPLAEHTPAQLRACGLEVRGLARFERLQAVAS